MAVQAPTRSRSGRGLQSVLLVVGLVALLWVAELADAVLPGSFDGYGVRPRSDEGLLGIVLAPLLHSGFDHLQGNSVPLLVLGVLIVLVAGVGRWLAATAIVWVVSGLGTWVVAPANTVHLGASGLVFGWLTYLVVGGVLSRRAVPVLVGVAVFLVWGGMLWGVLPGQPGISWQGHLFGAAGGVLAAYALTAPSSGHQEG